MAKTPVWRGSRLIHLQPGYPKEVQTANGTRTELVYVGPYTTLRAQRPKVGQTMTGFTGSLVEQTEIFPNAAGKNGSGTMRVLLNNESAPGDLITTGAVDYTWEIEWVDTAPRLEKNKRYRTGGAKPLSDDDLDRIEEWKSADTRAKRLSVFNTLSENAKDFVGKLRRGTDSFVSPAPVARKTTKSFIAPSTTAMGKKKAAKPFPGAPDGYEWLTTADKAVKQGTKGKWERSEEVTGAEEWDADLYPAGG